MRGKMQRLMTVVLALVLCATVILSACSTAWISQAEEIVAALIPAAANIVALVAALQGGNVSAQDLQAIQTAGTQATADLQLLQSLIAEYEKADAQAQPGILNQIQTAIETAQSNLSAILPTLHIKDAATQAKITAVVGVVLSEVQSLAAIVPLVNPQASAAMVHVAERQATKQPPLTANEFVSSYNATMTAKTGNPALDQATSGLRIHAHGKLSRWATGGVLK
ncbi:MAG TPA: hypothetical protein VIH89_04225 [Candidatus Sulfotelmatobacter sp.]|jgi:hypothetical protein